MSIHRSRRGFTLVEVMVVVTIIGVLAMLAIYGVSHHLAQAKTAEAKNIVGAIARATVSAFERDSMKAEMLVPGGTGTQALVQLCKSTGHPIPAAIPPGAKVSPDASDYTLDAADTGWTCLQFDIAQPVLYQYDYRVGGFHSTGLPLAPDYSTGASAFEASAEGDLDADGTTSLFAMGGVVDANGGITLATQVYVHDEQE